MKEKIYKIGQILVSNKETQVEMEYSGKKVIIPKGNMIIIGTDKLAHHLRDGMVQPLNKDIVVQGYDAEGLAVYLTRHLYKELPLKEIMEEYEITRIDFEREIEFALDKIGF